MNDIEAIARAICCAEDHEVCNEDIGVERDRIPLPCNWPLYREQARAALHTIIARWMEPTLNMREAGEAAGTDAIDTWGSDSMGEFFEFSPESAREVWQAMLSEKAKEVASE